MLGGNVDGLTIPIAKYVYDGNVIALDGDQSVLDELRTEVDLLHLTNVMPQLNRKTTISKALTWTLMG